MIELGTRLIDNQKYGAGIVVDLVHVTGKGDLYTVEYDSGEYRRYYRRSLQSKRFDLLDDIVLPEIEPMDDSNVVYTNFYTGEQFVDRASWEYWLSVRRSG